MPSHRRAVTTEKRVKAVNMRLEGKRIAEIQQTCKLSAPTIIALHQDYLEGGWEQVKRRQVGRPKKNFADPQMPLYKSTLEQLCALNQADLELHGQSLWNPSLLAHYLSQIEGAKIDERGSAHRMKTWGWQPPLTKDFIDNRTNGPEELDELAFFTSQTKKKKHQLLYVGDFANPMLTSLGVHLLFASSPRNELHWLFTSLPLKDEHYLDFFNRLLKTYPQGIAVVIRFAGLRFTPQLSQWVLTNAALVSWHDPSPKPPNPPKRTLPRAKNSMPTSHTKSSTPDQLNHLMQLEAESIHIFREVIAQSDKPVMLYSIGKDSAVMLHLAMKAFYPAKLPFPLLHVDTTWKFQAMYAFREKIATQYGLDLIVHINQEGLKKGINPFTHGSQIHTDTMKTQGLKQALNHYGFDVAFGGARRDEEKSRAKERIFSFRSKEHYWDPKNQRPELWNLYNTKKNQGESIRVFPLSNWTELDIWQYIYLNSIPIVPLYFSEMRPVVNRDGVWIMVDDDRMPLEPGEVPQMKSVRFRTLGCYPLTGAIESTASSLTEIIQEMLLTTTSERQGRMIDHDGAASMEKKKQEGYF